MPYGMSILFLEFDYDLDIKKGESYE